VGTFPFGGETSFPHAHPLPAVAAKLRGSNAQGELSGCGWRDGRGMAVKPRLGDAVLFFSFARGGSTDPASMHASCPTTGGVKWTATKWIHERKFNTVGWR
jgi:prolyl 4-hydroxylase